MNEYSDIVSWETRNRSGYLPKFHGFATRILFDTKTIGGIYTVSKLLGHSRVATTEMYLHCSQKQLEQAMLADPLGAGV